jgi:predicted dehydrogenase
LDIMTAQRFKVGIIGLQSGRSWAARAHIPALRALPESFEIVGVANTSLASAQKAAAEMGLPKAFAGVAELVAAPEVDIVIVTVKVPHHLAIVKAAIEAGKHVYCEWPLGNGLAEAETLAALARAKGVLGVIGTQARGGDRISEAIDLRRLRRRGPLDNPDRAGRRLGRGYPAEEGQRLPARQG